MAIRIKYFKYKIYEHRKFGDSAAFLLGNSLKDAVDGYVGGYINKKIFLANGPITIKVVDPYGESNYLRLIPYQIVEYKIMNTSEESYFRDNGLKGHNKKWPMGWARAKD
jgi:hypothetical protein